MNKKKQFDFSTAADIIKTLELTFDEDYEKNITCLLKQWSEVVGENIAKYSTPKEITKDGIMIINCKNSVVANEIFNLRIKINNELRKRAKKINIDCFKYIKITYNR